MGAVNYRFLTGASGFSASETIKVTLLKPIVQRDGVSPRQTHLYVHRAPRRAPSKQERNEAFPHHLHTLVNEQSHLW